MAHKRSAFAKLSDQVQFHPVVVEKVVIRRDVEPLRPKRVKTDPKIKKALDKGRFLEAMRSLADFETLADTFEKAWESRSLARTIEALRAFEREYTHTRMSIGSLPHCTEVDCMFAVMESCDQRSKKAWAWVIAKAQEFDSPRESKRNRQQRRRNKYRA